MATTTTTATKTNGFLTYTYSNGHLNGNSHPNGHLNGNGNGNPGPGPSTQIQTQTQCTLYQRATTSFVKKEFALAYEVIESGLSLLPEEEWKIKWDVLRITIEALLYASRSLDNSTGSKGKV